MKTKYKKIVVAIQTAFITSLVCSALPSYASDTELYKAPQSSVTTIMFMMDVSGSMDGENRLTNLKSGMTKLLQGDASQGIEPLPDKLVVGLSDFSSPNTNGPFGRIRLEARALGETSTLPGNRPIFQTTQTFTQPASRTITETKTSNTTQTRKQNGTRRCLNSWWLGCLQWGTVNKWDPSDDSGWSPSPNTNTGTWSANSPDWSLSGNPTATSGITNPKECITWNETNYNCTQWENSTKTVNDFSNLTPNTVKTIPNISGITNDIVSQPIIDGPNYGIVSNSKENCSDANCDRTQTRIATIVSTRTYKQTGVGSFVVTTTYYGVATETHRKKMLRAVNALTAVGGTPTGYAFAEVAAYLMGQTTFGASNTGAASGFTANVTNISDGANYIKPSILNSTTNQREFTIDSTKKCNTQGIYFLTDGEPTYYNRYDRYGNSSSNVPDQYKRTTLESFMKKSLGTIKGPGFSCNNTSTLGKLSGYSSGSNMVDPNGWDCIGAYTKALLDPNLNPAGVKIKTAVVGFGSDFNRGTGSDVQDAQKWGTLGEGGWYSGSNDADVVASVNAFLKKLQKYIPPVTTGSITIPVDNLDTQNIQPWGYFPQFDPAPDAQVTTWIGNLKKYQVVDNIIKDRDNKIVFDATKGISVDDPNDYWADTSIKKTITKIVQENNVDVEKEFEVRVGGALSQFKLGNVNNIERAIYTDRKVGNDGTASSIGNDKALLQVSSADLKANNPTNNFSLDTKRGYLAALFGYNVTSAMASNLTTSNSDAANTSFVNFLTQSNATLRQMGAVMHSRPILITQKGTTQFDAKTGDLSYKDRDDLIVFGTTQGLLHVIRAGDSATDSNAGKEVFTFVPNEMIEKQSKGFLNQENQGRNLEYGVDGPWTAYTEYVTKSGTNASEPVVTVSGGKQWLYGGLRMGGRSYYALDLSDVTSTSGKPKIKFRISPDDAAAYSPISYMGQSWSKPTLAWINWQGSRKLVMIVGGGYDPIYENIGTPTSSSIDKGAGVYIFDAETGSVLWWASANAAADKVTETNVSNMKRSVVSQIKAIDRNSDGLVDHLYFGDLGGQLWRVDLDSSIQAGKTANLAKRVTRILNQSNASDVPRFYSTPTFTIHNNGGSLFAVLTIGSGNLSSPMSETNKNDALYAIYDKDVTRRNLSVLKDSELNSVDINSMTTGSKQLVKNTDGNTATSFSFGGWYYPLGSKKRVLNDNIAIDSDLYVSIFNANIDIDDVDCYGGVRGESKANQFCLPYGQCTVLSGNTIVVKNRPNEISLGKGNIGISFGGKDKNRGLVLNFPTTETLTNYTSKTKFISQRWYER
ncbi:pilus assembly protein [Acinetobacter bereziniae]|uniref:pilus assembly protein n=1 Tax=Acinetobacter bereziniae TaxID=106648 RepID=UPI00124FE0DE|nr:PilC/PilY family type IV pilus protein [Acinetobacter bereziniae]